jgi:hypothetical protein
MRTFSANVDTLINRVDASAFYLVRVLTTTSSVHDTLSLMHTTASFDITVSGLGTFSSNNGLLSVEPPKLSNSVDRESYKIVYADASRAIISLFDDGLTGAKATVWVGFYNTTAASISGIAPGLPLTAISDLIIAYEGVVDTQGYTISPEDGTIIAVIECSSPVASLGLVRSFYTSKESMKQVNVSDTAFDQVQVGSKQTFKWGKE